MYYDHSFGSINLNDPVLRAYLFYTSVLIAKILMMELLVKWELLKSKLKTSSKATSETSMPTDHQIDRIKRAHLNDIENIPTFIVISFIYLTTSPDVENALLLIRLYTSARILHTIVYVIYVLPQPARAIAFITGEIITWIMIIKSVFTFC